MRGVSKLRAWLRRKGFTSTDYIGTSEYFTIERFPPVIRISDHVGRKGTETDKYVNIIPDGVDTYIFVYDRVTKAMTYKELTKTLDALLHLYITIPTFLANRASMKKGYDDSVNAVKLEYASKIADQRAALVKGAGTLVPIIADLQRLCNILNREK